MLLISALISAALAAEPSRSPTPLYPSASNIQRNELENPGRPQRPLTPQELHEQEAARGTANRLPGGTPGAPYLLGAGDVLEVMVWKQEDISRIVGVDPDGTVTLPLAGTVQASGRTTSDVREEVVRKLSRAITNPQVTVILKQSVNNLVSVLGKVERPGQYPIYSGQQNLLNILAMAGGPTKEASQRRVRILRDGREIKVNVKKLLNHPEEKAVFLVPGDIVYVPKKAIVPPTVWEILTGGASAAFIYRTLVLEK